MSSESNDWKRLPTWQRRTASILIVIETIIFCFTYGPFSQFARLFTFTQFLWASAIVLVPLFILGMVMLEQVDRFGRRRRKGQCIWYAYDLRASTDRCPECGKLIEP